VVHADEKRISGTGVELRATSFSKELVIGENTAFRQASSLTRHKNLLDPELRPEHEFASRQPNETDHVISKQPKLRQPERAGFRNGGAWAIGIEYGSPSAPSILPLLRLAPSRVHVTLLQTMQFFLQTANATICKPVRKLRWQPAVKLFVFSVSKDRRLGNSVARRDRKPRNRKPRTGRRPTR